jgi:glutathione gamma-glutamylcysteinyltransferase
MLRKNIKQLIRFQQAKQSGLSFRYTRPILQSSSALKTRALGTIAEPTATAPAVSAFQELLGVGSQPVREDLTNTFYQRQLPTNLVRFSSSEGKRYFREAMDDGRAEGFFPLTGNFTTQSEPAYCGPSSCMYLSKRKREEETSIINLLHL